MNSVRTPQLEVCYEDSGPADGSPILVIHGWPDVPRGWHAVAQRLHSEGFRTILPYLRGSLPTRFLSDQTPRDGSGVALAQDAIDLADALNLDRFIVVGHDWGARAGYTLAALFPQRVAALTALALAYQPHGTFRIPGFEQSRRFWYQWFQCTDAGAEEVRRDPVGFARIQWETWSPAGWFDEAEFATAAESFSAPDWAEITLNAYRSRWLSGEAADPRFHALRHRLGEVESIGVPTLMIQGGADSCDLAEGSEGQEKLFTAGYRRLLLDGVGHFPHREAPGLVADAILSLIR
jgi:pimeloyl-ACP methyl ester carboxylesterase